MPPIAESTQNPPFAPLGDEKKTSYQRPGKVGVDYDEYGSEMAPNSRVWKKYVEETDKADKELVGGWNNLLDIILLFAALFSAISTAFVLESSKDLKPDPAEESSQTLLLISQILRANSDGNPANLPTPTNAESNAFTPPRAAVIVNMLWFMSLSLSVAVSLVAILAKEWCYSFMSGRTGSILRQGRLRQQRWDGIERWKMKEILSLLPLLMHTALFLFAVGLSIYLWQINTQVALPVIIIASLGTLFYVITAVLPLFFGFCPYRTALTTFLYPYWIPLCTFTLKTMIFIPCLLLLPFNWIFRLLQKVCGCQTPFDDERMLEMDDYAIVGIPSVMDFYHHGKKYVNSWARRMRRAHTTDRTALVEQATPMDNVSGSMLSWMVTNCEESHSVDLALQALAGAEAWLPRELLRHCGAVRLVAQRLKSCLESLDHSIFRGDAAERNLLLDSASLYSRSFNFLTTIHKQSSRSRTANMLQRGMIPAGSLENNDPDVHKCINENTLLDHIESGEIIRYELAGLELNNLFLDSEADDMALDWGIRLADHSRQTIAGGRKQFYRQRGLLELVATRRIEILPPAAMAALINAVAKSYLIKPQQQEFEPAYLLVDLLNMTYRENKSALRRNIGVALTVSTLAKHDYPGGGNDPASHHNSRVRRAEGVYLKLSLQQADPKEAGSLLMFGLLGLLDRDQGGLSPSEANIKSVCEALVYLVKEYATITQNAQLTYYKKFEPEYSNFVPTIPASFDYKHHFKQIALSYLASGSAEPSNPDPTIPRRAYLEAVFSQPSLCEEFRSSELLVSLINNFEGASESPQPVAITRACLMGYLNVVSELDTIWYDVAEHLQKGSILDRLFELTLSTCADTAPYYMRFSWITVNQLLSDTHSSGAWRTKGNNAMLLRIRRGFTRGDSDEGPPKSVGELGFADAWIKNLTTMCETSPQNVVQSGIIGDLAKFYDQENNKNASPCTTTELPSRFCNREGLTWLTMIRELEEQCKIPVEKQLEDVGSESKVHETGMEGTKESASERSIMEAT